MGQGRGFNRPTLALLAHYDAIGVAPVSQQLMTQHIVPMENFYYP